MRDNPLHRIGWSNSDKDTDDLVDDIITVKPREWPEDDEEDYPELNELTPEEADLPASWEPQAFVLMRSPGRPNGAPPHLDDELDDNPHAAPQVYPAWLTGETFVVSGPYGAFEPGESVPRGRHFPSRSAARRWALDKYGAILEELGIPNKWAFRVPVPGGRHDPRGTTSNEGGRQ